MAENLEYLFRPRSIAVIGASRQEGSIGRLVLDNLLKYDFKGVVYPVNPKADVIHSIKCYHSIKEIPDEIDMAVIVVPKKFVPAVMEECGEKGVKVAVIITAGFKEVGEEGARLEREVIEIAKRWGIRVVGPNCMGVINTEDGVSMNSTFAPSIVRQGRMAFVSQSGALGVAVLEYISTLNLGISKFVSIGNRADVTVAEIVDYLADDPQTDIILLYMEGFGKMDEFIPAIRKAVKKKPVIAVKSGRTMAGARAASSHTGSLAGVDEYAEALFRQTGIIRAYSVEELFDMAIAFSYQLPPKGKRMAVITNGGGPGILTTDAIVANGLEMAQLSPETIEKLRKNLPAEASLKNPIDMIASADEESYKVALEAVAEDENVDGIIVIFITPINRDPLVIARIVADVSTKTDKPILGVFMGRQQIFEAIHNMKVEERVPAFMFPENAAKSMAALYEYTRIKERPFRKPKVYRMDLSPVKKIIERAISEGREFLEMDEVATILDVLRIPQPKWHVIHGPGDISGLKLRYPVAVKAMAPGLVHKSDVGAVKLNIRDEGELKKAMIRLKKDLKARGYRVNGYFIQAMASPGQEVIIGEKRYSMGPLIMFGLGGVFVEALKDVSFGIVPMSEEDAMEMIKSIKGYKLLEGFRGQEPKDIDAIKDVILRVAHLSSMVPEIEEMDINPLIVYEKGAIAVDARIKVSKG